MRGRFFGIVFVLVFSALSGVYAYDSAHTDLPIITVANARQLRPVARFGPITGDTSSLFFNSTSSVLYSGGYSEPLTAWEMGSGTQKYSIAASFYGFAVSPDDKFIAITSGTDLGGVALYDAQTGVQQVQIPCSGGALSIAFSPTNSRLLAVFAPQAGGPPDYLDFWVMKATLPNGYTQAAISRCKADASVALDPAKSGVWAQILFAPDGQTLIYGDQFLSVADFKLTRRIDPGVTGSVLTAAFSPDGKRLALAVITGDQVQDVAIYDDWATWEPSTQQPVATLGVNQDDTFQEIDIHNLEFSPNDQILALYGNGMDDDRLYRFVWLWDAATYKPVVLLKIPYTGLTSFSDLSRDIFSPDGKMVTLTDESTIYLYGVQ